MNERRYDIDWLRLIAIFGVFLFHCARFFVPWDWHLKDAEQSRTAELLLSFLAVWGMPLFFLLSGSASWYGLSRRTATQYLLERARRLLIPFYTVGLFILLPPQWYIDRVYHTDYGGTLWRLIPPYYGGSIKLDLSSPNLITFWNGHLWFLQHLFLVSLLTLPLLLYLRSNPGAGVIDRVARWCDHRGGVFLFLIPIALVRIAFRGLFSGDHTWADLFEYAALFVIGYVMAADKRFTESIKRHGWVSLALGIGGFFGAGYFLETLGYSYPVGESFSWTYVLFQIVFSIATWGWIVFILNLGAKHLNFSNKLLVYGGEALLPFYLLHQTIILGVGWFVIPWEIGILPKYLIITPVSFALILALYELLVRRFNVVRFFFGMRPKQQV